MKKIHIIKKEATWSNESPYWNNCHCSTIVVNENGDKLVAYFAGGCEGTPDLAIWISHCVAGVWQEPRRLTEAWGLCHYNPVLHYQFGRVWLFYKRGYNAQKWYTMVCHSDDFGRTWTIPEELLHGRRSSSVSTKNKLIVGEDGGWYGPCSLETDTVWDCFIDISNNYGLTWEKHDIPFPHQKQDGQGKISWQGINALWETEPSRVLKWDGVIQPTLWEWAPGQWSCLMRSTRGKIFRSDSTDNAKTWCEAYPIALDNPNSGIDLVKTEDGTLVLVFNPVTGNWAERSPLSISVSEDNGLTWSEPLHLEVEPGEFSYPAIISQNGKLHITYTERRKHIIYCEAELV